MSCTRPAGSTYVSPAVRPVDAETIRRAYQLLAPVYAARTGRHLTLSALTTAAVDAGLDAADSDALSGPGRVQLGILVPSDVLTRWTQYARDAGVPRALLTGHAAATHLDRTLTALTGDADEDERSRALTWLASVRPARMLAA